MDNVNVLLEVPENEFILFKDRDGKSSYEFYIDKEKDCVTIRADFIKDQGPVSWNIDFPPNAVYEIYRLLEKYLKTPSYTE